MLKGCLKSLAFLVFFLIISAPPARASDTQGNTGGLRGYVTDAFTGNGVSSVIISVTADGRYFATMTNSIGYYEMTLPTGRGYVLTAYKRNYETGVFLTPPIGVSQDVILSFTLTPEISLSGLYGWVKDESDAPIPDARLLVSGSQIKSDSSGFYSIELSEGEKHTVLAQKSGYKTAYFSSVAVGKEEGTRLDIKLESEAGIKEGVLPFHAPGGNPPIWYFAWAAVAMSFVLLAAGTFLSRKYGMQAAYGRAVLSVSMVLFICAAGVVLSCGPDGPENDSAVLNKYFSSLLDEEGGTVQIYELPAYYDGRSLDFFGISEESVSLRRASDGKEVKGTAMGFDIVNCELGIARCARGVFFRPGGGDPCDLDGDTAYELEISGAQLGDGEEADPIIITFRTAPAPEGYEAEYCSERAASWWAIRDVDHVDGLNGGVAGEVTVILFGVEYQDPFNNFEDLNSPHFNFAAYNVPGGFADYQKCNQLNNPPYIPVLKIFNNSDSDLDLGGLAGWIQIVDGNGDSIQPSGIALPDDALGPWETLPLYVAEDGTTYYMLKVEGDKRSIDLGGQQKYKIMDPKDAFAQEPAAAW